jgi:hypothetical membrane protein
MSFYEAGNFVDYNFPRYSFYRNWISDLGRRYGFVGQTNFTSKILFQVGMMFGSFFLLTMYSHLFVTFKKITTSKIGFIGAILGLVSSLACISIAFTTFDLYKTPHRICTIIFGVFVLISNFMLIIVILKLNKYPTSYKIFFIISNMLLVFYILITAIFGFDAPYFQEVTKIVTQKIVVGLNFIALMVQAYGLNKIAINQKDDLKHDIDNI